MAPSWSPCSINAPQLRLANGFTALTPLNEGVDGQVGGTGGHPALTGGHRGSSGFIERESRESEWADRASCVVLKRKTCKILART